MTSANEEGRRGNLLFFFFLVSSENSEQPDHNSVASKRLIHGYHW